MAKKSNKKAKEPKPKPIKKVALRKVSDDLEYLQALDYINCLSQLKPSINQDYTYVSFKIPTK